MIPFLSCGPGFDLFYGYGSGLDSPGIHGLWEVWERGKKVIFRRKRQPKLGLALGGGGARGGIHVGVLKVLEDAGIQVSCVTGTSIGALVGAFYALSLSGRRLEERIKSYLSSDTFRRARFNLMAQADGAKDAPLFSRIASFIKKEFLLAMALTRPYLISREEFLENLAYFIPDLRMEGTRIPFAAMATDLETGEGVLLKEGSLRDAVYASCTYPGVVEAVRLGGRLLVDGGVVAMVPVEAAKSLGADLVLAVNVEKCIGEDVEGLSGIEVLFRADDIMAAELTRIQTQRADILIHPGVGNIKWYDFQKMPEYVAIGEKAAREKLPEIMRALGIERVGSRRPHVIQKG